MQTDDNLEWVLGIGPTYNQALAAAGIRTTADLAGATPASLRAAGIRRNDHQLAAWIAQAQARLASGPSNPPAPAAEARGGGMAATAMDAFAAGDITSLPFGAMAAPAFTQPRLADPNASDYPLLGPPSISFNEFANVFLRHPESPLWLEASPSGQHQATDLFPYWNKIISYGIDPLIALAFFAHESTLGRDASIAPLHNWGNLKPGGQYASFPTWLAGLDAWCRHVTGPLYIGAGHTTIAQIVPIYAPPFENPGYYDDLLNNYIHPFLREDPDPVYLQATGTASPPPTVIKPDPDYAIYADPTINLTLFRQVLQNAGSPAFDEVNQCYQTCTNSGVNPAVALAFFALESNYGTTPGAADRKNWGNLSASGQIKTYPTWAAGLAEWCNHFRIAAYANAQTISTIVPIYQPSSAGGTVQGYNNYIQRLHDLIKGWADQLAAAGGVFAPQ